MSTALSSASSHTASQFCRIPAISMANIFLVCFSESRKLWRFQGESRAGSDFGRTFLPFQQCGDPGGVMFHRPVDMGFSTLCHAPGKSVFIHPIRGPVFSQPGKQPIFSRLFSARHWTLSALTAAMGMEVSPGGAASSGCLNILSWLDRMPFMNPESNATLPVR